MMPAEIFESLNAPQAVFCLFFAIFWGLVANAQVRWKAFDWPLAITGRRENTYKKSWSRLWRSLWYLTVVPVLLFLGIISILSLAPRRPFDLLMVIQLAGAILAAHAAFAPYRFWLSAMERNPGCFYYKCPADDDEPKKDKLYAAQPWGEPELRLDPIWAPRNSGTAWSYVGASTVFACIAAFVG